MIKLSGSLISTDLQLGEALSVFSFLEYLTQPLTECIFSSGEWTGPSAPGHVLIVFFLSPAINHLELGTLDDCQPRGWAKNFRKEETVS